MNKTEVFVSFTKESSLWKLKKTLEAWDTDEYEPIAIEVSGKRGDFLHLVAAEGLATGDYLLATLGTKPGDEEGVIACKKGASENLKVQTDVVH